MKFLKEDIRKYVLRTVRVTGSAGMSPGNLAAMVAGAFPPTAQVSVLEDIDYLAGKGLLEFFASPISAGDRRVRITSAGIDFIESNPE